MGYGLDASTAKFEMVTVLNLPMLFTCCRVDQDTVPEDLYIYEVSHEEDVRGKPVQISEWIRVNHWGTLLTSKPIRLDKLLLKLQDLLPSLLLLLFLLCCR